MFKDILSGLRGGQGGPKDGAASEIKLHFDDLQFPDELESDVGGLGGMAGTGAKASAAASAAKGAPLNFSFNLPDLGVHNLFNIDDAVFAQEQARLSAAKNISLSRNLASGSALFSTGLWKNAGDLDLEDIQLPEGGFEGLLDHEDPFGGAGAEQQFGERVPHMDDLELDNGADEEDPFGDDPFGKDPFGNDPFGNAAAPKKRSRAARDADRQLGRERVDKNVSKCFPRGYANVSWYDHGRGLIPTYTVS